MARWMNDNLPTSPDLLSSGPSRSSGKATASLYPANSARVICALIRPTRPQENP